MPVVPWERPPLPGAPDQLPNFYHAVLAFERLNVQCIGLNDDQKRSSTFWGKKSAPPEKILTTLMRKGPPPYVGMEPRMVNPALVIILRVGIQILLQAKQSEKNSGGSVPTYDILGYMESLSDSVSPS